MMERLRRELQEKRYLDTLIHLLVATLLCIVFSSLFTEIDEKIIVIFTFIASFLPDIDHLLLYKRGKFYNFRAFLRWVMHSSRYRIAFELFHNLPAIITIMVLLPFIYVRNKLIFMFFVAFLFHLLVDLVIDRIVLRNIRFWRFGA